MAKKSAPTTSQTATAKRGSRAPKTQPSAATATEKKTIETSSAPAVGSETTATERADVSAKGEATMTETNTNQSAPETSAPAEGAAPQPILKQKKISANGKNVLFAIPGVPGAVRFSLSMFNGAPPETIDLTNAGLNLVPAKATKAVDPEKAAAREKVKAERLAKTEERAAKAIARAKAAEERLTKLRSKMGVTAPAEGTAAPASSEAPASA